LASTASSGFGSLATSAMKRSASARVANHSTTSPPAHPLCPPPFAGFQGATANHVMFMATHGAGSLTAIRGVHRGTRSWINANKETSMYIGAGALTVIVVIVLLIWLL